MNPVKLRAVEVGTGAPKVIVPIACETREEILSRGKELAALPIHVAEWRADFYDDVFDIGKVLDTLAQLRTVLSEIPILFTFRTGKEGGEKEISMEDYTALNIAVVQSGSADAIDVEIFSGDQVVKRNMEAIHAAGKVVVGSSHDFQKTPSQADLIYRLRKMQDMGADLSKIAVMPQSRADVLTLLSAAEEMSRCYADRPFIAISMSADGVLSRLCGEVFGSAMTFGMVEQASAPGQIPVEQLNTVLEIIHNAL